MKRTDLTNLGGLRFTQNRLAFVQESFAEPLAAIAKLCGDKSILYGCEVLPGGLNVTSGWIVVDGELIEFIGGAVAPQVVITNTPVPLVFGDNTIHDVHFNKTASCGVVGSFPFSDLEPLLSFKNIWKKDDIRMCMKDALYEADNFDAITGIGINREVGWRLLSKVYSDAAGAVMVNKKDGDADFGIVGDFVGEKTHQLTIPELPAHKHAVAEYAGDVFGGTHIFAPTSPGPQGSLSGSAGSDEAHNNIQPSFVVLTLIKL